MRPRLPRHQRSTVNAIGKIRDPDLGKKITACCMGRMPQAVALLKRALTELGARRRPDAVSFAHAPIKVTTRQSAWLARCDFLSLGLRGGRSLLWGRARLLVAVTAHGVGVLDAHSAAFIRAGSAVPLPRLISVGPRRITGVDVRIDIGLGIGRRHADDHRQNAQATDQSALHQFTSLWTRTCHNLYW